MSKKPAQETWTEFIAGTNLHYLRSTLEYAELADGVVLVHHKNLPEYAPPWLLEELKVSWARHGGSHGGFSSHVLLVRNSVEHATDANPIWDPFLPRKRFRAELAFWLLKSGRLQTSGTSGPANLVSSSLHPVMQVDWDRFEAWAAVPDYPFEECDIPRYREVLGLVSRYGDVLAEQSPWYPINVALRAFASASDTDQSSNCLIDAFTSIEALIGDKQETTFRLRFRVAHLLADDDDQRAEILDLTNRFYAARSTLVHGSDPLTGSAHEKFQSLVRNPQPMGWPTTQPPGLAADEFRCSHLGSDERWREVAQFVARRYRCGEGSRLPFVLDSRGRSTKGGILRALGIRGGRLATPA